MDMRFSLSLGKLTLATLIVYASGCNGGHPRPANVPPTAAWVDHTFIDCSVETKPSANRCTVYKGDSGEILADGLFLLSKQLAAAETPELRYAAFGHGKIYLQDARVLVQWVASKRDPSHRVVSNRLKALAGGDSSQAIDCNSPRPSGTTDDAGCAMNAFAAKKAFYVRYYQQGYDSFAFRGYAGDGAGNVYEMDYDSRPLMVTDSVPKEAQLFDDNHVLVIPCHKPVTLERYANGNLICQVPLVW